MDRDILEEAADLTKRTVALKQFAGLAGAEISPEDKAAIQQEVENLRNQLPPSESPPIELKPDIKPVVKKYRSLH